MTEEENKQRMHDLLVEIRYDALPVAFCKRDGRKERATLSFECIKQVMKVPQ